MAVSFSHCYLLESMCSQEALCLPPGHAVVTFRVISSIIIKNCICKIIKAVKIICKVYSGLTLSSFGGNISFMF